MFIPYTYYLYHRPTNTHYYGVRWKKGCHPGDLWISYFSSSKKVKNLIEQYGPESFDVKVRKTFSSKDAAIAWEEKVLRRLQVHKKSNWLNICVSKSIRYDVHPLLGKPMAESTKQKIGQANKGKKRSAEVRNKLSEQRRGENHWNYGNKWSEETKRKNSESNKAWRLANPDKASNPPNPKGRIHTEESKRKISEAKKRYWERKRSS